MKYSTIKLLELINAAVCIIVFGIAMTLQLPAKSNSWMISVILIMVILMIPLFIIEHKCNRKYPQWNRLWRMPPAAIVAVALLLIVMISGAFVTENGVAWMVIILVSILSLVPDYYYAHSQPRSGLLLRPEIWFGRTTFCGRTIAKASGGEFKDKKECFGRIGRGQ